MEALRLKPFTESRYPLLVKWIDSETLNFIWGGASYRFPLTVEQIYDHIALDGVIPFLLMDDNVPAGFVELFQVNPISYRICRVFISPDYRGRGLAQKMIQMVTERAAKLGAKKVSLHVFESNHPALKCYLSQGFTEVSRQPGSQYFDGQRWTKLTLEKNLI